MELIGFIALILMVWLVFQRWFWMLLGVGAVIGLVIAGIGALFGGQVGPGLGFLFMAWLVWGFVKKFGG